MKEHLKHLIKGVFLIILAVPGVVVFVGYESFGGFLLALIYLIAFICSIVYLYDNIEPESNKSDTLEIPYVNDSDNSAPDYAKEGDSGMDIRYSGDEPIALLSGERTLVPTGLHFATPEGYEIQVRPRSGLAHRYGITVLNTPGTVDSSFRGEVKIIIINNGLKPFTIVPKERLAQIVFVKVEKAILIRHNTLNKTERGYGGFGHTGEN